MARTKRATLKPGWLARDIEAAHKEIAQWDDSYRNSYFVIGKQLLGTTLTEQEAKDAGQS